MYYSYEVTGSAIKNHCFEKNMWKIAPIILIIVCESLYVFSILARLEILKFLYYLKHFKLLNLKEKTRLFLNLLKKKQIQYTFHMKH